MSYRRQKRWWNAYILFYEQVNETQPTVEDKTIIKTMQELTIGKCRSYQLVYQSKRICLMPYVLSESEVHYGPAETTG